MPSIAPIVLTGRETTPVNHTYVPVDVKNGTGFLVERRSSGSYVGEPKLSVEGYRVPKSKRDKGRLKLEIPVVVTEVVNGVNVDKVIGVSYLYVETDWDPNHTSAQRAAAMGMVSSSVATAQAITLPVLLGADRIYG